MIAIMFPPFVDRLLAEADGERRLRPGQTLFAAGAPVRHVHVVLAGSALLVRHHRDGGAVVLQRAQAGDILAEASMFARTYHCDAVAQGPTRLAVIPRRRVEALQAREPAWLRELTRHLATEVQRVRARAELLTFRRVADRLDAWLAGNGGVLPDRGRWNDLALEIGVTPEALYRELAARRARATARKVKSSAAMRP